MNINMISKSTNRKIGIILQYTQMGLSILISFIYTPIMLKILGASEYGLYNLSNSVISYLSLLSLGFGASYIRFYSRYKAHNNEDGIGRLNGLYIIVFTLMGLIALICGALLVDNISIILNDTYTQSDKQIGKVLMIIMTVNLAWSFPASIFTAYVTSQERFIFQKLLNMMRTVLGPFLTLPILLMGYGSIGMVTVSTVVTLIADVINIVYCKRIGLKFIFHDIDVGLFKEIFKFSIFIAINQVIDQINWATDKVILGKVCSGTVVAYYSIGAQINTYFTQFSTTVSSVFVPEIHRIESSEMTYSEKNYRHTDLFTKVGRIQFILLSWILSGFFLFGKYFISIWAGEEYGSSYYVALILMTPAIIPLIQNTGIEIQRAKNKHQFRSIVYLIMAIINIIISIYLSRWWADIGAALGTMVSLVLGNGIVMNVFYQKVIGINIIYFWKKILLMMPSVIVTYVIALIVLQYYPIDVLWKFVLGILMYTLMFFSFMFIWGLDADEKSFITKLIRRE